MMFAADIWLEAFCELRRWLDDEKLKALESRANLKTSGEHGAACSSSARGERRSQTMRGGIVIVAEKRNQELERQS
jgi:uncharacterized protein YhfF